MWSCARRLLFKAAVFGSGQRSSFSGFVSAGLRLVKAALWGWQTSMPVVSPKSPKSQLMHARSPKSPKSPSSPSSPSCRRFWVLPKTARCRVECLSSTQLPLQLAPSPSLPLAMCSPNSAEQKSSGAKAREQLQGKGADVAAGSAFDAAHELQKPPRVMLPTKALHRLVSPAAKAVALNDDDRTVPSSAQVPTPPLAAATARGTVEENPLRRKTAKVRFVEVAEWLLFDVDQPGSSPVVRSFPTQAQELLEDERTSVKCGLVTPWATLACAARTNFEDSSSDCCSPDLDDSLQCTTPHARSVKSACFDDYSGTCSADPHKLGKCALSEEKVVPQINLGIIAGPMTPQAHASGMQELSFMESVQDVATPTAKRTPFACHGFGNLDMH